jgi:pimeloyl-ACP methyl ester carboxylesterase
LALPSISSIEVARPDTRLHVEVRGEGTPVLLLPGAGADHYALLPQVRALTAAGFQTYTLDPRGVGRSLPAEPYDVETLAADALAVLDAAGLARAHLFGHSLGSVTALLAASRSPERVLSVAAAAPWPHTDPFLATLFSLTVTLVEEFPPEAYARWLLTFLVSPSYLADPARMEGTARSMFLGYRALPPKRLARYLGAGRGLDLRPMLPKLERPVLVLVGDQDRMIPPAYGEAVAALLPEAELYRAEGPGASHLFHFELADEVNRVLVRFFRRHTPPDAASFRR